MDLGEKHRIEDKNGEHVKEVCFNCECNNSCFQFLIETINEIGDVTTLENIFHGLEDGDYVTFSEIKKGMDGLDECKPLKIQVKSNFHCIIYANSF